MSGPLTLEQAIAKQLKSSLLADGLSRGLREVVKAIESGKAQVCFLGKNSTKNGRNLQKNRRNFFILSWRLQQQGVYCSYWRPVQNRNFLPSNFHFMPAIDNFLRFWEKCRYAKGCFSEEPRSLGWSWKDWRWRPSCEERSLLKLHD